ncbi:MAG: ribonuclease P protein component [Bacteroidales bacterium]|nr:ribonuclease P protein component [Bacteroidales bacterium]
MTPLQDNSLPKTERLSGTKAIERLMSDGRRGGTAHLRWCWVRRGDEGPNRIMVSVPKRLFKRAVLRNLLKRRLREAYRTQKGLLAVQGIDFLVSYSTPELLDSATIRLEMAELLGSISLKAERTGEEPQP